MKVTTIRVLARAHAGTILTAAVLTLPFAGYGAAEAGAAPEGTPIALGLFSLFVCAFLATAPYEEGAPFRHTSTHLIARSLTGERSVDLNRITTVRLLTTVSYSGPRRTLLVRDAHGVRLDIATERSRRKLRRAIEKADANVARGVPGPRVSRAARTHLGLAQGSGLFAHTLFAFLLLVTFPTLYMVAVLRLGGQ